MDRVRVATTAVIGVVAELACVVVALLFVASSSGACARSPPPPLEIDATPTGDVTVTAVTDEFIAESVTLSYGTTNVTWATLAAVPPEHWLTRGEAVRLRARPGNDRPGRRGAARKSVRGHQPSRSAADPEGVTTRSARRRRR